MEDAQKEAFKYQLDILKNEINSTNDVINQINTITQSIKNWAITVWTGSIALILIKSQYDLKKFVIFTCVIPLLFWVVDGMWRRHQSRMIYRITLISKFLNSEDFKESFQKSKLINFKLLDMRARNSEHEKEYKKATDIRRILMFNTIKYFYGGLAFVSIILGVYFIIN
ncbi:hypothetical protein LY28_02860 [Ruminiclostridium sufflavum DSM 19573]|uniref:Uncharacterized protein n=1 Tax=Ruminiclostridium sufflavum DSM 19573 TaxID=1121337 RepID=A0A318Y3N3_9FIRM|nr:hypothetical protein [Ruminiclostridium sufflavum]PYG86641.1 hypothetical protein LY28_02860 [Ruminiclostridium sufflavum DSM 19573]